MLSSAETFALGCPTEWTQNWTLRSGEFCGEIMDESTRRIWLSCDPMTTNDFATQTLPPGFWKSGMGRVVHDGAVFTRSPGAVHDGPLLTMDVGGRRFAFVALPGRGSAGEAGEFVVDVEKHHRVLYRPGRDLDLLRDENGDEYILQISDAERPGVTRHTDRVLPVGWTSRTTRRAEVTVLDVPSPARIVFLATGDVFHGPVTVG